MPVSHSLGKQYWTPWDTEEFKSTTVLVIAETCASKDILVEPRAEVTP